MVFRINLDATATVRWRYLLDVILTSVEEASADNFCELDADRLEQAAAEIRRKLAEKKGE